MTKISEKTKYAIIGFGILIAIAASNYHGYRVGVTAGQEMDILIFGDFFKKHHECIESNNLDCAKKTSILLLTIFKSKISALEEKGTHRNNNEEINEIKKWAEDTLAKYE